MVQRRYLRQRLVLGDDGQQRLANARVVVIGAGGLGSPVLQYLAAAGVGTLVVVDGDTVSESNLPRQLLYSSADVGSGKAVIAARRLSALNPAVRVQPEPTQFTAANARPLLTGTDLVVDASDNFPTRYLIADAAALLGVPCVWGSVLRFDGSVSVFWENGPAGRGIGYRDLFPEPPDPEDVLNCADAGVLGSLCGTVGALMATEAVKLLTGIGSLLLGRVLILDALTGAQREIPLAANLDRPPVTELIDYEAWCGVLRTEDTIDAAELERLRAADSPPLIVDVREAVERAGGAIPGDLHLPLSQLLAEPAAVPGGGRVVLYCAAGVRSARAARAVRATGRPAVSLDGGYDAWRER